MKTKINDRFFEKLGKSQQLEAALTEVAERVVERAKATAPVDTGDYADSIGIEVHRGPGRTVVRAVANDPGALAIEARTGNLHRAGRSVTR